MRNVFIFQLHVNNQTEAVVGNETVSYQAALTVLLSDHLTVIYLHVLDMSVGA